MAAARRNPESLAIIDDGVEMFPPTAVAADGSPTRRSVSAEAVGIGADGVVGGGLAASNSLALAGIRRDPATGEYIGRNGKRVNPDLVYDRKIHCPEYLFTDKVISPVFRNILPKYAVAYFRPCVLRRTATGNVDNHVVRCVYIDGFKQQVQFVEESGQAKRSFNISEITLVAVEKPAKSILGVALAPTMCVVLKTSPAIQGSKIAAEAQSRALKQEAQRAEKEAKQRRAEEKKAAKLGLPPPSFPSPQASPLGSPRSTGGAPSSPSSSNANNNKNAAAADGGDSNDIVLRFEPFPPEKPPKGTPSPTAEQVRAARQRALVDANRHMAEFIALLKHFNPYIVTRGELPHGLVSRMPLQLSKPPGRPNPPAGPPEVVRNPPTDADLYPPEEDDIEEEYEEEEYEEEEVYEEEEPEEIYVPPPPPPPPPPPIIHREIEIDYAPPPPPAPAAAPPPTVVLPKFITRPREEYDDEVGYPKFPNYSDATMVRHLFVREEAEKKTESAAAGDDTLRAAGEETEGDAASGTTTIIVGGGDVAGGEQQKKGPSSAADTAEGGGGASAVYDPAANPLAGPPLLVAGAVTAFPIAFNSTYLTDEYVSAATVGTTVASDVVRCSRRHYKEARKKERAKRRHEVWVRRTQLAAAAGQPLPSPDEEEFMDDGEHDNFYFDSEEEDDEENYYGSGGGVAYGGDPLAQYMRSDGSGAVASFASVSMAGFPTNSGVRPEDLLPLPTVIDPPNPRDIYDGLQSPYAVEDKRLFNDLTERRTFIETQLSHLEKGLLPQLLARRKRADGLLAEMTEAARIRGQPLAPTTLLAHPNYDRHVNLAVIIFDICRVRKQKMAYEAAMEGERAAGVVPSAYKHPQGVHDLL